MATTRCQYCRGWAYSPGGRSPSEAAPLCFWRQTPLQRQISLILETNHTVDAQTLLKTLLSVVSVNSLACYCARKHPGLSISLSCSCRSQCVVEDINPLSWNISIKIGKISGVAVAIWIRYWHLTLLKALKWQPQMVSPQRRKGQSKVSRSCVCFWL